MPSLLKSNGADTLPALDAALRDMLRLVR